MSLITIPDVENAAGDVKTVYDEMLESWGVVPEPIKAFSHNSKLKLLTKDDYYDAYAYIRITRL